MDAVLNWVLQGCLATVAIAAFMRAATVLSARARYGLWWLALVAILSSPAALPWTGPLAEPDEIGSTAPLVVMPVAAKASEPVLLVLWGASGGWLMFHLARALVRLRKTRRSCQPFPANRESRLRHWSAVRSAGRGARLALSKDVHAAAVLGFRTPLIAVSPAVLQSLDDDELDQIVLHEWAHVQRRDDVANLLQQVIRATVGWHPAVWWISRRLALEREIACDERVVRVLGSAGAYAACLTKLAAIVSARREAGLVPAALAPAQLTTRIGRLLSGAGRTPGRIATRSVVLGTALVLASVGLAARIEWIGLATPMFAGSAIAPVSVSESLRERRRPAIVDEGPARLDSASPTRARALRRKPVAATAVDPMVLPSPPLTETRSTDSPVVQEPVAHDGAVPAAAPVSTDEATTAVRDRPIVEVESPTAASSSGEMPSTTGKAAAQSTPWGAMADAGVAVGRGSQKAAVATAGFFKRFGKSIGGSF